MRDIAERLRQSGSRSEIVERLRESGLRSEIELHEDREEAANRIKELEAKLDDLGAIKEKAHRQGYEQGKAAGDAFGAAIREHVERLEAERDALQAKLAKAVRVLQICCNFMEYGTWPDGDPVVLAQKTIAKLKGQDDE